MKEYNKDELLSIINTKKFSKESETVEKIIKPNSKTRIDIIDNGDFNKSKNESTSIFEENSNSEIEKSK